MRWLGSKGRAGRRDLAAGRWREEQACEFSIASGTGRSSRRTSICYVSLVGLYIVIDAFSNLDEFTKRAEGVVEMLQVMGRFYLIHQSLFFDQLSGVIGMMAAIFTVTWMQRNNEQLAMLAAGISTHRAIRPVLVSSLVVGGITCREPRDHHAAICRGAGEDARRRRRAHGSRDRPI